MLTGPDFHERHVLDDGTEVTLRHIRPADAAEMQRGFARLSRSSRYLRFQGVVNELSPEMLRYLTTVDGQDHVALVATRRDAGGAEVGLGVARVVRVHDDPCAGEVALTVLDEAQHKGLGRALSVAIARAALERGMHRLEGPILSDNGPVRGLLEEVGASVRREGSEMSFEVDLDPPASLAGPRARLEAAARKLARALSPNAWFASGRTACASADPPTTAPKVPTT